MKLRPLMRAAALLGLVLSGSMLAGPVAAAPADIALLQSYIGDWRGRGTLTSDRPESVVCRLGLSQGNQDKVNYSGRCTLAGTTLSINGTLAYVNNRYEAAMTSNARFSGTAIGRKQGNRIVFNLQDRSRGENNEDYAIDAQIVLNGNAINVNFSVTDNGTGKVMKAAVPFAR